MDAWLLIHQASHRQVALLISKCHLLWPRGSG